MLDRMLKSLANNTSRPTGDSAQHKVIFLLWYGWVDIPLVETVQKLFKRDRIVKKLRRESFEKHYLSGQEISSTVSIQEKTFREYSYRGLGLWEICKSSICDHLLRTKIDPLQDLEVIRQFYSRAENYIRGFESLMDTETPSVIVVEQGYQFDMRAAVEVARKRGIRTVAIENSFLKNYFFIDDATGGITNRHTLSRLTWDRIRARKLSQTDRSLVREFAKDSATTFKHCSETTRETLLEKFQVPSDKRLVLLIGQVSTDASIVMDSPVFEDQVEFMQAVVNALEKHRSSAHLLIRLHPKESFGTTHFGVPFANGTYEALKKLGITQKQHVTVLHSNQANTYELMSMCEFGITLNSQAGFEMLLRRKPVIVVGDAFYARKGFTLDVGHDCQLEPTIDFAIHGVDLTNAQFHDVENFAYSLFFEYLVSKNLVDSEHLIRKFFQ